MRTEYAWFYGQGNGTKPQNQQVKSRNKPVGRKGLQRKAHRICIGKSEDLERKARFFARFERAKNAPEILEITGGLRF
jgi:hypothetical protein